MCDTCNRSYKHRESLYNHKTYECNVEPKFQCEYCKARFRRKDQFKVHVATKHRGVAFLNFYDNFLAGTIRQYICPKCSRSYMRRKHLNRHLKFECGKEPQFQCPHCPYRAKYKASLKSHVSLRHTYPNLLSQSKII
ncbi:hypothetical protein O3M35_011199 [Rhynocoris fuscipes]|uniref:C2H2-type domain-containing protein n=1 Tax=Rhynocoris fuscipes TaxID=488301 RepID=A0AAW1CVR6_9HEMI